MAGNEHDAIIVRSTIALAHSLGLRSWPRAWRTQRTREMLQGMGCDQIQGYHLSLPLPPEQLAPFLAVPRVGLPA